MNEEIKDELKEEESDVNSCCGGGSCCGDECDCGDDDDCDCGEDCDCDDDNCNCEKAL